MNFANAWDEYHLDDVDDDHHDINYIIDYEIEEDDWPEYEIPESDLAINKEALLAIRLAQITSPSNEDESVDDAQHLVQDVLIDTMQQQGSSHEEISQHGIGGNENNKIITADDTMTMLLLGCIFIWLLFQLKDWWKLRKEKAEKSKQLPCYHDQK